LATASDNVILPHLAFIGQMGSGKSTCAERMSVFMYDRISFAEELRNVVARLYGREHRNDRDKLQQVGRALRAVDPDVWIRPLERSFHHSWGVRAGGALPGLRATVDDCRYPNEAACLRGLPGGGFRFVLVEADRNARVARLQAAGKITDESQLEHESERYVRKLGHEFTIYNNPGDDLDHQLIELINKVAR
jgi:dephospho-CoA kinase